MTSLNLKSYIKDMFKDKGTLGKVESLSIITLWISVIFVVIGISIGTFISGIPVLLAIIGSFLSLIAIVLFVIAELWKSLKI
ncbi:MAG: hypothetical protein ABEK36_02660 [Candidatus Aenigmatarchaeota archaeon]